MTVNKISDIRLLVSLLKEHKKNEIDIGIEKYFFENISTDDVVFEILYKNNFPKSIEKLIELYGLVLDKKTIDENGIVFTPKYISDFIVELTLKDIKEWSPELTIIDPGCGAGVFLISAIEYLQKKFNVPIKDIIQYNIFGFDIEDDNVSRCKKVLNLFLHRNNQDVISLEKNIICIDSLDTDWRKLINRKKIDYIIGNPPYVNPHSMNKEYVKNIRERFTTTKKGTFNIFYAFIEKALEELDINGGIGYIIPNNFLSISSASEIRNLLQKKESIVSLINFSDNMIFKPTRTYNCIIHLNKKINKRFKYCVVNKTADIDSELCNLCYSSMNTSKLDKHGWNLVDEDVQKNLNKIEGQYYSIKNYIRTGIATLRDAVYFIDKDNQGYFKKVSDKKIYIEDDVVKTIYKIPELKNSLNLDGTQRYILFPYKHSGVGYELISEDELKTNYPGAYEYLELQKSELAMRDKGKGVQGAWYAYGRSQGLNKYGKKLLFPTFSNIPKFVFVDDEDALFCNGYAIFENEDFELDVLMKILNSKIMDYYVKNTSYSIEGGYYCYQKKYIQNFSIPNLSDIEIQRLKKASKEEIDEILMKAYEVYI